MYKSEQAFKQDLKKRMVKRKFQVQLIEVGAINRGVPDLSVCKKRNEWIELKNSHYATYEEQWHIDFREGQQAWLRTNYVHGGRPMVAEAGKDKFALLFYSSVIRDDVLTDGYLVFDTIDELIDAIEVAMNG